MVQNILNMPNDERGHLEEIDVFVQPLDSLSQRPHLCLERGSLVDELLGLIPQGCIVFFEAAKVVL